MSELALRSITGVLLVIAALVAEWFGGTAFAILAAAAATAIYYEWSKMVRGWGIGWHLAGFLYALAGALSLLWVRERGGDPVGAKGFELVLWAFIVTWSADIGAFFAGRSFGGPKLAPTISPNKTWSGFAGGLVAATLLGGIWAQYAGLDFGWLLLAPVFAAAAAAGDLFESGMKRRAGVKDSGRILPGHGGVFDRLDGLLPVAVLTALGVLAGLG